MAEEKKPEEDKVRRPDDEEKDEDIGGVTERALRGLDEIIPGFGELVKGLKKSEAFEKRLRAADAEIERQLGGASPLARVGGTRRSVIPPKTTMRASRAVFREEGAVQSPRRDVVADIFDEGDCLKVIAEVPGVDENDIKTEVKDSLLILSAQATNHTYYEEIELPCSVKAELNLTYKNGILQITLKKEQR